MNKTTFLALAALMLAACVSSSSARFNGVHYDARPKDWPIDIYLPRTAPASVLKAAEDYKPSNEIPAGVIQIGKVDVSGAPAAAWSSTLRSAQYRARQIGGDAVALQAIARPLSAVSSGMLLYAKTLSFTVLRYEKR